MRPAVFGATGRAAGHEGRTMVRQGRAAGPVIRALARLPGRLDGAGVNRHDVPRLIDLEQERAGPGQSLPDSTKEL